MKQSNGRAQRTKLLRHSRMLEPLESRLLLSGTLYVDLNSPGPAHDGTSWETAYLNPQEALAAAVSGDTIRVADGTYKPTGGTDRNISFNLKTGVAVLGGYAGYGAADPDSRDIAGNMTVLSGDIGMVGSNTDNSYHVVVGSGTTATAVLDGFTITTGNANGSTSPTCYGGGMYNSAGSPTVTNCTFSSNSASYGAGMYNSSSSPALTNCTFSGNEADLHGGGMYNYNYSSPSLVNCIFNGNAAIYGGGMGNEFSSPTLTNCIFGGNSADDRGGGMYNTGSSSPTLTNCTFSGNAVSGTSSYGSYGGGMYNGSSLPKLTNCIIWGSGSSPIYNYSSAPTITYSDIQGGYPGTGNINADPLFVRSPWAGPDGVFGTPDDDYGDLRLRPGSPAVDLGSNSAVPSGVTTDLAGNPRVQNGKVDLGAYEGSTPVPAARTLYVDVFAVGTNTGTSWSDPFASLQSALLAAVDGDTIRVADGTYRPSAADRMIWFVLKASVRLVGGYAGYGAADPDSRDIATNVTVLSGDIGVIGSKADNSYHVVVGSGTDATAVLDGFTITAGNANGSGTFSASYGGGVYIWAGSPTVINCTFSGNSASDRGGGVYNNIASPTLTNCTFSGNSASRGGGTYNYSSAPALTDCTFIGNSGSTFGGGMYNVEDFIRRAAIDVSPCEWFSGTADRVC